MYIVHCTKTITRERQEDSFENGHAIWSSQILPCWNDMKRLDERWHSSNFGKLPMHRRDALQFNLSVLALEWVVI